MDKNALLALNQQLRAIHPSLAWSDSAILKWENQEQEQEQLHEMMVDALNIAQQNPSVVAIPEAVSFAMTHEMEEQVRKIARLQLRKKNAKTLEEKNSLALKIRAAEARLKNMRLHFFSAEDAVLMVIKTKDIALFEAFLFFADAHDVLKTLVQKGGGS